VRNSLSKKDNNKWIQSGMLMHHPLQLTHEANNMKLSNLMLPDVNHWNWQLVHGIF
jgi:hypothetical protein